MWIYRINIFSLTHFFLSVLHLNIISVISGFMCSSLLLVLLCAATFLAYMKIPILQRNADKGGHLYMAVKPEIFTNHLSDLESRFPSQRPELWKRSKIHLERHLKTAQPTEPVSLILAAGHKAERTLHCLAKGLASSFSSVLNASVLHIDGASKAKQDSDDVKLDIDNQLQAAFAGDKPVAVIHRLEELPPGSTLIFYRYCDHENAAFKRVFLLFTVLLPQEEFSIEQTLQSVEEIVQDHVQTKLVGSNSQTSFNQMDTNKFGGLWSRISHLILPVAFEEEIQRKGCNWNKQQAALILVRTVKCHSTEVQPLGVTPTPRFKLFKTSTDLSLTDEVVLLLQSLTHSVFTCALVQAFA